LNLTVCHNNNDIPKTVGELFLKTLVVGWFSFEQGHATAGDLLVRDVVCDWLERSGYAYDVAVTSSLGVGVDWRSVAPETYSHVVFVCGPFEKGELEGEFLARFGNHRLIGLDLSMQLPLDVWNPFDFLIERDSSARAHPEMAFLSAQTPVPVVGVCLVESYPGALVEEANVAIERLVASREMAVVSIDTRLDVNGTGLRSRAEIESLIARMDALVTTRLHGLVLALKNGVPVVAIDPMANGAKIRRQAETIGWPVIFNADNLADEALQAALAYCLSEAARTKAQQCYQQASNQVEQMRDEFITALTQQDELEEKYLARLAKANHNSEPWPLVEANDQPIKIKTQHYLLQNFLEGAKGLLKWVAWRT
jgi:hypothetical protein